MVRAQVSCVDVSREGQLLTEALERGEITRTPQDIELEVRLLVGRVALLEMIPEVLERAALPFPSPVRTLDALHLASIHFLKEQGQSPRLATYDRRMAEAAEALGFETYEVE